jgi:MerR HTH family regulatory protein
MARAKGMPGYYSTTEAMEFFGIIKNTLKRWARRGYLSYVVEEKSRHRYYDEHECQELFNAIEKIESKEFISADQLNEEKQYRSSHWVRFRRDRCKKLKGYPHPVRPTHIFYKRKDIEDLMEKMPERRYLLKKWGEV